MSSNRPLICVFAGSSTPSDPSVMESATALGTAIGQAGFDLVYGAGDQGVMGACAIAAREAGAGILAVTLEQYRDEKQIEGATVQFVENDDARFQEMAGKNRPAALFLLPSGIGGLREGMQGLEMAIYRDGPPLVLVKTGGYLDGIKDCFNRAMAVGLIKPSKKDCLKEWQPGQDIRALLPQP